MKTLPYSKLVAFSLPIAAGLTVAGGLVDPGVDESTSTTYMAGLAHGNAADRYQVSALILHFAFLAFLPAVVGLWGISKRGWLRHVGLVLGVMGAATMPGLVTSDYYDIGLATSLPAADAARAADAAQNLTGAALLVMPAVIGLGLGLVVLLITAVRARAIPFWAPLAVLVAFFIPVVASSMSAFIAGGVLLAVVFAYLARHLLRAPVPAM